MPPTHGRAARRGRCALRGLAPPGGRLLVGDGIWAREPDAAARELFGEDVLTLPELERAGAKAGWTVREVSTASPAEWDEFEASFRAGRERWAAEHPADPRAGPLAAQMRERRAEYETVYRGVLGFAYLVLDAPLD